MRSYHINVERLVNQLIPHYLGGRKLILLLQSLLSPMNSLGKQWEAWANEKRTEAGMTSQIFIFEYFLTQRFKKYFKNKNESIVIADGTNVGTPLYWEENKDEITHLTMYRAAEKSPHNAVFRWKGEKSKTIEVSFVVVCPALNTELITEEEFRAMISYYVNRYRIAGKKFMITFNNK